MTSPGRSLIDRLLLFAATAARQEGDLGGCVSGAAWRYGRQAKLGHTTVDEALSNDLIIDIENRIGCWTVSSCRAVGSILSCGA
jgi:hypothetical protein